MRERNQGPPFFKGMSPDSESWLHHLLAMRVAGPLNSKMQLIMFISWGCMKNPEDKGSESPFRASSCSKSLNSSYCHYYEGGGTWRGSFLRSWEGDFVKGSWVLFQTASLSGGRVAFTWTEPRCSVPLFNTRMHDSIFVPSPMQGTGDMGLCSGPCL